MSLPLETTDEQWLVEVALLLGETTMPDPWKKKALAFRKQGFGAYSASIKMRQWLGEPA